MTTGLGGYGSQSLTSVTGIVGHPDGITTAQRVGYTAGAGNPGAIILVTPDLATQYTFSAWVYNEGPTENIGIAQQSVSSGGSQGVLPSVWTKLTWTYTTHAATAFSMGVRIGTPVNTGSFLITGIVIEKAGASLGGFFDGNSVATADFTHAWAGAVNNSASRQSAIAMSGATVTGTGTKITYMSSDRPAVHTKFIRMVIDTTNAAALNTLDSVIPTGIKRTNLFWLRTSRAMTIQIRYRTTDGAGVTNAQLITTAANRWESWRIVGSPNIGDNAHLSILISSPPPINGDVVDLGPHMVVEGEYNGDYLDGTKAFSKWDGTVDASTSIGYPPQLYDIAGKPDLDLSSGNSGGVAIPVDAFGPRTIYLAYESYGLTLNYPNYAIYGVGATKGITFQTGPSGGTSLFPRMDFPTGSTNLGVTHGNGRYIRPHVVAFSFNNGLTTATSCLNGGGDRTDAPNPGTGWDDGRAGLTTHADGKGLRMLVFYAEHDRTTRLAINRYLGNKYGAYVA